MSSRGTRNRSLSNAPHFTWGIYFPGEKYSEQDRRANLIHRFSVFFSSDAGWRLLAQNVRCEDAVTGAIAVDVDFAALREKVHESNDVDLHVNLEAAFSMQPKEAMPCLAAAVHAVMSSKEGTAMAELPELPAGSPLSIRLVNYEASKIPFRLLLSNLIDRLVTLIGTVVRVSTVKPFVKELTFTCAKCGAVTLHRASFICWKPFNGPMPFLAMLLSQADWAGPEKRWEAVRVSLKRGGGGGAEWRTCKRWGGGVAGGLSLKEVGEEAGWKDGKYSTPTSCSGDSCRSKALTAQRSRARCGDRQRIRLEELAGEEREEGRVPRTVECNLLEGLVDSVIPGDVVTLCGLVQYTEGGAGAGGRAKAASGYVLYVDAISVSCHSKQGRGGAGATPQATAGPWPSQDALPASASQSSGTAAVLTAAATAAPHAPVLTMQDLQDMMFFVQATEPFQLLHLVHSLCPAISGHELVKCGMLLALFGGVQKFNDLGDHVPIRGDIHVMVVGDPGLGKSQMLKAACAVAPRGVYVCGNTASAAGLT
ncbi:hypothetical protein CYMTET_35496, partial [Cymbomonas tetramitiformis]